MGIQDYELTPTGTALFSILPLESMHFRENETTLGSSVRTAGGRLVTDVIAQKHRFDFSWDQISYMSSGNSLGGVGIEDLRTMWEGQSDLFLRVPRSNVTQSTYKVRMIHEPFDQGPVYREDFWYGSLNLALEEV